MTSPDHVLESWDILSYIEFSRCLGEVTGIYCTRADESIECEIYKKKRPRRVESRRMIVKLRLPVAQVDMLLKGDRAE